MVYHHPNSIPKGNAAWLGPLRLLTSDDQAAELLRMLPKAAIGATISCVAIAELIKLLPWPQFITNWYNTHCKNSVLKNVAICMGIFGFGTFLKYIITKWVNHMTPRPGGEGFFFGMNEKGEIPAEANRNGCVIYNPIKHVWHAWPYVFEDRGNERAFNTIGMHFWNFLHMEFTVGLEYPLTALFRVFMHYMTPFDIKWTYNQKADRKQMYLGVLNTTLVCFVNQDQKDKLRYGNTCLKNIRIPYNQSSNRTFDELIIELDHTNWEVASATIMWTNLQGGTETMSFGHKDMSKNVETDANGKKTPNGLNPDQELHQVALLAEIAIALYSHSAIHWWANGVGAITPEAWKTKPYSDDITQWMNSQAVYLAWLFFGNSEAAAANLLIHNSSNGINFHGGPTGITDLQKMLGDRSMFHQVSSRVRKALAAYKEAQRDKQAFAIPEVDGILAATMMHNLDHYCCAKYFPLFADGNCIAMKSDLGGLIMTLVKPIWYWTRRLLVRQHARDPICKLIYETCLAYEKELKAPYAAGTISEFANYALAVGCAF